jgi:uncharacterized protein YndB with AHSA1/START domain
VFFRWSTSGMTITSTVYSFTEGSRILWGGTVNGITGIHEWAFTDVPDGVHVATSESFSGAPVEADAEGIQRLLEQSLQSWLQKMKATAEGTLTDRRTRMSSDTNELALHLERTFPAPRSRVFRMHAEPDLLARWWGPTGFTAPSVELDLRVGGAYRIAMQPADGPLFYLTGEFREVDPPTRLSYTFRYEEPDPDDRENVVAITLRDAGESTEVAVDQRPFATEARLALHRQGWTESLDRLHQLLTNPAP